MNDPDSQTQLITRWGFIGGLWHAALLALGMALTQPTTVIAAFVSDLTGSTVWVGGLTTLLTVAATLPQLLVARWIEPWPRKKSVLLTAIYVRVTSWALLAFLVAKIGASRPETLAWVLIGILGVFYFAGGMGGVPYTDIIGKVIPKNRRGAFFGGKQALAAPLAVSAALAARKILAEVRYPNNYALLFALAASALLLASLGFVVIREPDGSGSPEGQRRSLDWNRYWQQLRAASQQLKTLISVQLFTGFSLMALPFYVVYAKRELGAPAEALGWFLLAQVVGGVLSNLVWARLVDRFGSRRMLAVCASVSMLSPLIAVLGAHWGWRGLLPAVLVAGAAFSGRTVGFNTALLELAPPAQRPTYSATNRTLVLPIAFLPLMAGLWLEHGSYTSLFLLCALMLAFGAILAWRWAAADDVETGIV